MGMRNKVMLLVRDKEIMTACIEYLTELSNRKFTGASYNRKIVIEEICDVKEIADSYVWQGILWSCDIEDLEYWMRRDDKTEIFENVIFLFKRDGDDSVAYETLSARSHIYSSADRCFHGNASRFIPMDSELRKTIQEFF